MAQFEAIFVQVDGLDEEEIGPSYCLDATDLDSALNEAFALSRPDGANFVKILRDGQVVTRHGFDL